MLTGNEDLRDKDKDKKDKDADDVTTNQSLEHSNVVCADDQSTIGDNIPGKLIKLNLMQFKHFS